MVERGVAMSMSRNWPSLVGKAALWSFAAIGVAATVVAVYALSNPMAGHDRHTRTRVRLVQLSSALEFYRLDNARYPTTEQGLQSLLVAPTTGPRAVNYPASGYLKRPDSLLDEWGRPVAYEAREQTFTLVSLGADGSRGGVGFDEDLIEVGGSP